MGAPELARVALIAAWRDLADRVAGAKALPSVERTWFALLPPPDPDLSADELRLADDWLWLVKVLDEHDPKRSCG